MISANQTVIVKILTNQHIRGISSQVKGQQQIKLFWNQYYHLFYL